MLINIFLNYKIITCILFAINYYFLFFDAKRCLFYMGKKHCTYCGRSSSTSAGEQVKCFVSRINCHFLFRLFAFVSRRSHFDFPGIAVQLCSLNCLINELLFYNVIFFKFASLNN